MKRTIPIRFLDRAAAHPERIAIRLDSPGGTLTWGEWRDRVHEFAAAVMTSDAGDSRTIAILAGNGTEWPIADLGKARGTRAGPWGGPVGVEGIEIRTERKVGRHRRQQPGARALPVFHRKARQCGQRVAPLPSGWRLPEHMQPIAYLRLLQFR